MLASDEVDHPAPPSVTDDGRAPKRRPSRHPDGGAPPGSDGPLESSRKTGAWRIDPADVVDDPLLMCLYEATRVLGRPMSREALVAGLPIDTQGMSPRMCVRAANRAGFLARVSRAANDARPAPPFPVIALPAGEPAPPAVDVDPDCATARAMSPAGPGEAGVAGRGGVPL